MGLPDNGLGATVSYRDEFPIISTFFIQQH